MESVLPHQINYGESLPSLPVDTQCISIGANPSNTQTAAPGQLISFDLVNRGFLIPDSLYISYQLVHGAVTTAAVNMCGTIVYTPFSNLSLQFGSQTVESCQQYNVLMNTLVNCTLSPADKYGLGYEYGWTIDGTMANTDGRTFPVGAGGVLNLSAPLPCLLTNAEKLIPLFAMPQVRINLTVDSFSNMITAESTAANMANASGFSSPIGLQNLELRYKIVDFGGNVEEVVKSMGPHLFIKSQSFATASQTLPNSTGYQELIYNMRYQSLKNLIAINGNSIGNKQFDSVDLGSGNSEYSFQVGGQIIPQRPLNTSRGKAVVLSELRNVISSVYDIKASSFSINPTEFSYNSAAASTSYNEMAKFYVATNCERLQSNDQLLTGVSTVNSPISYRISLGTASGASSTVTLIANYDAIIDCDVLNRMALVKT